MRVILLMIAMLICGIAAVLVAVLIAKYRDEHMPPLYCVSERKEYEFNTEGLVILGVAAVVAVGFIFAYVIF